MTSRRTYGVVVISAESILALLIWRWWVATGVEAIGDPGALAACPTWPVKSSWLHRDSKLSRGELRLDPVISCE
jgi:hypothetical protein